MISEKGQYATRQTKQSKTQSKQNSSTPKALSSKIACWALIRHRHGKTTCTIRYHKGSSIQKVWTKLFKAGVLCRSFYLSKEKNTHMWINVYLHIWVNLLTKESCIDDKPLLTNSTQSFNAKKGTSEPAPWRMACRNACNALGPWAKVGTMPRSGWKTSNLFSFQQQNDNDNCYFLGGRNYKLRAFL